MSVERGIHASAVPNALTAAELHVQPDPTGDLGIDPRRAGWRYLSFRAFRVRSDAAIRVGAADREAILIVLGGGGIEVSLGDGAKLVLPGRVNPFEALPWAVYFPVGSVAIVGGRPLEPGDGTMVALAEAPVRPGARGVADRPTAIGPDDVAVEIRGAGNATRQINHIVAPGFPADRLLVVEVLTPAGNWSSWPPHKHDVDDMPAEAVLEEIYYYRFARAEGWGIQRLYRADGSRDDLWAVRDGELVVVPDGYHPFVAAHGYDAYYLNALAGDRRTMACSFDPALDWTRRGWAELEVDPRVPLVKPSGWPRPIDRAQSAAGTTWTAGRGAAVSESTSK